jgi:hypothetical protein
MLESSAKHIFETFCTPTQIREMLRSGQAQAFWQEWVSSGFNDALAFDNQGGSGLHLVDLAQALIMTGTYAVPVPLGESMVIRAAYAQAMHGPATIAAAPMKTTPDGQYLKQVPFAAIAQHVVAKTPDGWALFDTADAIVTPTHDQSGLTADLQFSATFQPRSLVPDVDWLATGALMRAVAMAGAIARLTDMTVEYAKAREQFGQPIARRQAIQQQISVMTEHSYAAQMAAQIGLAGFPSAASTAIAKSRVNEAAAMVGPIAHAVHGAIGITEEHDLQLFSRLLIEGRQSYGSESYWNRRLGENLLDSGQNSLAFVQSISADMKMPTDI